VRILLPKASKGIKFDLLFTIDVNLFDVEMLLPSLFHLVRTKGRRVGKPIDPDLYGEYFARMIQHERLKGFSSHSGRKVLDRWVRTSIVKMGKRGRAHTGEKMTYLYPTTMLSYKAGLPKEVTRLRGVHNFVYTVLLSVENDPVKLDKLFQAALGEGLILDESEKFDGRYDGRTDIDIEALLTICFLDGLPAAGVSALPSEIKVLPRLAKQTEYFARDIIGTLRCYQQTLSTTQLNRFLLALINFHLFVYSMRLMSWVIGVSSGNASDLSPEFFLDCTGERGSYSDELARSCVERDLEMLERYIRASLRLRTLDRYLTFIPSLKAGLPARENETGTYLTQLLSLAGEVKIQAKADQEFEQICAENGLNVEEDSEEREVSEAASYLKELRDSTDLDSIDRLVRALFEAQRKSAMQNVTGWFNSVSGFNRSYGIMSGNSRGARRVARYTLSNELLSALVYVALADHGREEDGLRIPAVRLPLKEFLKMIEERYGLLIDKPPANERSAEAVEAARRNLEAFKVRLRQIGVFENLSDDFDAQYIRLPMQVSEEVK
jgi:hypothetical protein